MYLWCLVWAFIFHYLAVLDEESKLISACTDINCLRRYSCKKLLEAYSFLAFLYESKAGDMAVTMTLVLAWVLVKVFR